MLPDVQSAQGHANEHGRSAHLGHDEAVSPWTRYLPPLRQILAEAPEELEGYVRGFVADKIADAARVEAQSARVLRSIAETRRGYAWPRNLRELKNYTERSLLMEGQVSATPVEHAPRVVDERAAPAVKERAAVPESVGLVSSGLLGPRAKAGEVSLEELTRAYATRVHALTQQNKAETARRLGVDWRRVARWIDPARLGRWLTRRK